MEIPYGFKVVNTELNYRISKWVNRTFNKRWVRLANFDSKNVRIVGRGKVSISNNYCVATDGKYTVIKERIYEGTDIEEIKNIYDQEKAEDYWFRDF